MLVKNGSRVPEGFESFTTAAKNLGRWNILKAWTIEAEDRRTNTLDVLRDEFAMVRKIIKAKNEGKNFNLYLHAGESQHPENDMMIDAYILEAKRIGYEFNLFRYLELEKKLIVGKIALEVCPISNQRL